MLNINQSGYTMNLGVLALQNLRGQKITPYSKRWVNFNNRTEIDVRKLFNDDATSFSHTAVNFRREKSVKKFRREPFRLFVLSQSFFVLRLQEFLSTNY